MTTSLKIGQRLKGRLSSYLISGQVAKDIWTAKAVAVASASNPAQARKVVIKTSSSKARLDNERTILTHFKGHPYIRAIVDETDDPPSIVLRHLEDDLLAVSFKMAIQGLDIKFVAKRVLQALQALHEDGYTHTDIKPDNILVNHNSQQDGLRFADVQLADCGDVCRVDPREYLKVGEHGPHMGAAIFRSPEAMLNLRWGMPSDIWSFGATLVSLIWGRHYHIFKPDAKDADFEDDGFLMHVLIRQIAVFGPAPVSYTSLIADEDEVRWDTLGSAIQFIMENNRIKPFVLAEDKCLTKEDKQFILKIMKLDPRDRPSARELLED